jgi:hypothetical protein
MRLVRVPGCYRLKNQLMSATRRIGESQWNGQDESGCYVAHPSRINDCRIYDKGLSYKIITKSIRSYVA